MRIVTFSALTLLSGCSIFVPQWEGVWLLEFPVESDGSLASDFCESSCDENFENADCPEEVEFDSEWTYSVKEKLSPEAYFIEIFNGKGGEVFAVIGSEVYKGTDTVKELTLTWEGITDSENVAEHEEGYTYEELEISKSIDKIVLTKAQGAVTGTWSITTESRVEYQESDEWDPGDMDLPVGSGQIPSQILDADDQGDNRNSAEDEECSGGDCELMLETNCTPEKQKFDAIYAGKYENGMYTGISGASQPAGSGLGGGGGGGGGGTQ
jgi:hypothetical protein